MTAPSNHKPEEEIWWAVQEIQGHKTPGTPKFLIVRPTKENKKISTKD